MTNHKTNRVNLVFIPGLLCNHSLFEPQIGVLGSTADIMVADHRGADDIKAIAAAILAVAPPRFALAGLSMGGYIAFEMFRQAGDRISRLALLDTSARPDTPLQTARRRELVTLARSGRFGEVMDTLIPNFVHPSRHNDKDLLDILYGMARDTGIEAFMRQELAIMNRPDSRPNLASIMCPVEIIVGSEDALTPPELAREMAAAIPGARLHELPGCGHIATLEQPEQVNTILRTWLERVA